MAKERLAISRATQDKVLNQYNHQCAVCARPKPQLHHIDENPANNDPMNLIPLCPNCHLTDQHDPTRAIEPEKLKLFRQFKDPLILAPQFHPLFVRLKFLDCIDSNSDALALESSAKELVDFVAALAMGAFYSKSILQLTNKPRHLWLMFMDGDEMYPIKDPRGKQRGISMMECNFFCQADVLFSVSFRQSAEE